MSIKLKSNDTEFYMKLMSKITVASVTSILTLSSAMAEVNQPIAVPAPQTTNIVDLSYAFGDNQALQIQAMTQQEMDETEGAVAPLVAVGVMTGTRFIAQRWVTQKVAQNMVKRGATNIMAPNRSVAKNIAGRNPIREYHPGDGSRYTHYHPNPRNGSHIWYGNPR